MKTLKTVHGSIEIAINEDSCVLKKIELNQEASGKDSEKRLLSHALQHAKKLNLKRVELETDTAPASFYKLAGFKPIRNQAFELML